MRNHRLFTALSAVTLIACGSGNKDVASSPPPPPIATTPACVISADCPAGQHCNLEECVQDCNTTDPCTGELTCSPRATCLPAGAPVSEPAPATKQTGTLSVSPQSVSLLGTDSSFQVQLTSSSSVPVNYRVVMDGPHLSMTTPTGTFTHSTTITVNVNSSMLPGEDVAGSIEVISTLGDITVQAPIHVGLTGSYRGVMHYNGGPVQLGDAALVAHIIETNGDLSVALDSRNSLLFPPTAAGETTGHGSYTVSAGIDVTVSQLVDTSFGGARNHFGRPIGRTVRIQGKPAARGEIDGTFTETVYGLFAEPITTTGTVQLQYEPQQPQPMFTLGAVPTMPANPANASTMTPSAAFGWNFDCRPTLGCSSSLSASACMTLAETHYAHPLTEAMDGFIAANTTPFTTLPNVCATALTAANLSNNGACGLVPPLACALTLATQQPSTDAASAMAGGRLVNEMLAPAMMVAKNDIVTALSDSFSMGGVAEQSDYTAAETALAGPTAWVTQVGILEYLRSMSPAAAMGAMPTDNSTRNDTYPAARALADLFSTMSKLDGEVARIGAASTSAATPALVTDAQQRAVILLLESEVVAEILREWQTAPDAVKSELIGVLDPMNTGFAALLQGANAFGVPNGYVPFVYRPEEVSKGPTNFEQMLAIAQASVASENIVETAFLGNMRSYETGQYQIQTEIQNVSSQYDTQLQTICGPTFDPDQITSTSDWSACGAGGIGSIGDLVLQLDEANAAVASAQAKIAGMVQKIGIDTNALAETQNIQASEIAFTDDTGTQLAVLTYSDGMLAATQAGIQAASNASLVDFGAAFAAAAPEFELGAMRAEIDAAKSEIATMQTMNAEQTSMAVAYVDGMAAIQKEMIDVGQAKLDIEQTLLASLDAALKITNDIAQAKVLWTERQRALALVQKDPANDPSYRLLEDQDALLVLAAREEAQQQMYLAAAALEYELNMPIAAIDGAVLNAHNNASLTQLAACLGDIFNQSLIAYGEPQTYTTTVSVRQMLGITGPRTDSVTGQTLSEGDQFRELILKNQNFDGNGGVGITFATDLQSGNGLWSTDVCSDRISGMQAQLVGDFLGDNMAQVNLELSGTAVMRSCDGTDLTSWSLGADASGDPTAYAVMEAGVNTYGTAPVNTSLFGQSVARAKWTLVVPSGTEAPANADVVLTNLDDVVLLFTHQALPIHAAPVSIDISCLGQ
jgi:hypothetical protein